MHAHRDLITGVLKGRLDSYGFVISDWECIHQIPGDHATQVVDQIDGVGLAVGVQVEELFFAEDEWLLGVIHDTLDAAPPGEPVLSYERWVRDPGQDLPALVDESFAALAGLAG